MRKVGLWTLIEHGFNLGQSRCYEPLHPFNTGCVPHDVRPEGFATISACSNMSIFPM